MPSAGATVRALLLALRHAPDRLLHERRRMAVTQRILRAGRLRSVLVLCHGNVCRSPFAAAYLEELLNRRTRGRTEVRSAGFIGPDRESPGQAIAAARSRGVDLTPHRSVLVTTQSAQASDLVVVMSAEQARRARSEFHVPPERILVLGDLDPMPITKRTILDPWQGEAAQFDESYDRIVRCVDALVDISRRADAQ